jgi:hypothetical protein
MPAWPAPQSMKMGTTKDENDSTPLEVSCKKSDPAIGWLFPLTSGPPLPLG